MRILLVIITLLLIIPVPADFSDTEPTELEIEVHQLINMERTARGLAELTFFSALIDVSRAHSDDMLQNGYFAHENLQGETPFDRMDNADIPYTRAAENIFFASGYASDLIAQRAVQGWMDSDGHRQNILTDYQYTGIGIAQSGDTYYITQMFLDEVPSQLSQRGILYTDDNFDQEPADANWFYSLSSQAQAGVVLLGIIGFVVIITRIRKLQ